MQSNSWVWAVATDCHGQWLAQRVPTKPWYQSVLGLDGDTYWVQRQTH